MKKLIATSAVLFAFVSLATQAELLNDATCTLNKGYTVAQLFAIQKKWMAAIKKQGFDEAEYSTQIFFPVYTEATDTTPTVFLWRGRFKDGEAWGKNEEWFKTTDWGGKFSKVMNCGKASMWLAPQ
jgi:hypothetical protein